MDEKNLFNSTFALVSTFLTYIFGAWDEPIKVLIILMIIDYVTGVIAAIIQCQVNSHVGFNGILRKSTILLVLIVSVMLDRLLNQGTWVFRTLVCYFYIANEGISILENAGKCGVPFPDKLVNVFEQLKKKEEE